MSVSPRFWSSAAVRDLKNQSKANFSLCRGWGWGDRVGWGLSDRGCMGGCAVGGKLWWWYMKGHTLNFGGGT